MAISQDWWDKWWEADYSWEGLAEKDWEGWVVSSRGRVIEKARAGLDAAIAKRPDFDGQVSLEAAIPEGFDYRIATLQDYWRDQKSDLILSPDGESRFTRIHLPLNWRDGSATNKDVYAGPVEELITLKLLESSKTDFSRYGEVIQSDRRVQFQGCVFGDFSIAKIGRRLADTNVPKAIHLNWRSEQAAFCADSDFGNAVFSTATRFDNAAFSNDAWFDNAAFHGYASFDNAIFWKDGWFSGVKFLETASFDGAVFSVLACFDNCTFAHAAGFSHVVFGDGAWFDLTAFSSSANFRGSVFLDDAYFIGLGVEVERDNEVQNITLETFEGNITGQLTTVEATLPAARRFFVKGNFQNCRFLGDVDFKNRSHGDEISFKSTFFGGAAIFHGSVLHQGSSFQDASFDFVLSSSEGKSFAEIFAAEVDIWRKEVATHAGFANNPTPAIALRNRIDNFRNCKDFRRAKSSPRNDNIENSTRFSDIEAAFRKLKLSMEEVRHKTQEQAFYRMELLARRRRRDDAVPFWERMLSVCYRGISDFGGSILRPLLWLFAITFFIGWPVAYVFSLLFADHSFHFGVGRPIDPELWNSLSFSFSNVFPFGVFGEIRKEYLEALQAEPGWRVLFGFFSTVHSLIALMLVFLAGLAIRRRFQIS